MVGYGGFMATEERSRLTLFDGLLVVGGGLVVLFVIFKLLGFVAGVLWFGLKVLILVAIVTLLVRLVFGRRKSS